MGTKFPLPSDTARLSGNSRLGENGLFAGHKCCSNLKLISNQVERLLGHLAIFDLAPSYVRRKPKKY